MTIHKIGGCAGKFLVLHNGHKEYFYRASLRCDELHVFVEHDAGSTQRLVSIEQTLQAIGEILKKIDIKFKLHITAAQTSLAQWEQHVIALSGSEIVMFNSKEHYQNQHLKSEYISCNYPPISSSELMQSLFSSNNYHHICKEFMPFINKKVVISGVESCGKTQMSIKLAELYQTAYSEEYGRYHANIFMGGQDNTFTPNQFIYIAMQQIIQDKKMNLKAQRFLVVDTDPVVTLRFLKSYKTQYQHNWNDAEYENAVFLLSSICETYKSDLTFILAPNVNYVQDGTRWEQTQNERLAHHEELLGLYQHFNIPYVLIEESSYEARLNHVESIIKEGIL